MKVSERKKAMYRLPGSDVAVARYLEVDAEHRLADEHVSGETGRKCGGNVD